MTVTPLDASGAVGRPDTPIAPSLAPDESSVSPSGASDDGSAFAHAVSHAFGRASDALQRAATAESAFVAGRGGLQEMVLERAQADVALSIASATATHVSQSLQTILGMQV